MNKNDYPRTNDPDEHETIMTLLDEYATDSLAEPTKKKVALHLASCLECQQALRDISRLHTLLQLPEATIRAAYMSNERLLPTYKPGISNLADHVLATITNEPGKEVTPPSRLPVASLPSSQIKRSPSRMKSWKNIPWYLGLLAAGIAFLLLIVWITPRHGTQTTAVSFQKWHPYQNQRAFIQQGQNVFTVEYISIMGFRDFDIIYASRSAQRADAPHVDVISHPPNQSAKDMMMNSTMHPLGTLGDFAIGEIHVHVSDRVGQFIVLQGTFAGQTTPWQMTLCYQEQKLFPFSAPETGAEDFIPAGFIPNQGKQPEIIAQVPFYQGGPNLTSYRTANTNGYTHLLDLVALSLPTQPKTATMYLRIDDLWKQPTVQATIISQAEYQSLEGPQPTPVPRPTPIFDPNKRGPGYFLTATARAKP